MAALVPYAFEGRNLRSLLLGDAPWFIAGDVAAFLGHRDAADLKRSLDDDEKGTHSVRTLGGEQEVSIISEPGLYRTISQRRTTSAIPADTREFISRFQRWVFHEVLPSIRRTGSYSVPAVSDAYPEIPPADSRIQMVAECRRIHGARAARKLWVRLGMPGMYDEPSQPPRRLALFGDARDAWCDRIVESLTTAREGLSDRKLMVRAAVSSVEFSTVVGHLEEEGLAQSFWIRGQRFYRAPDGPER